MQWSRDHDILNQRNATDAGFGISAHPLERWKERHNMLGKGWLWICPVQDCVNCKSNGTKEHSPSPNPLPYGAAGRMGRLHMKKKHPGLDPDTVILKKVE